MENPVTNRAARQHWDIFCTVIDNYGDIGVCWRLARQLVAEHACRVRLWVDDLPAFHRLCPELDTRCDSQTLQGVEVRSWPAPFPALSGNDLPDGLIEAFACTLPETYVETLARHAPHVRWINLEYLSAENWVADCHGLPSPHPRLPLLKHFFIPGFDARSAGLLRERGLLAHHAEFDATAWWGKQGVTPESEALRISLFAYDNRAIAALLDAWRKNERPHHCLVTDSRVLASVNSALGRALLPGDHVREQSLALNVLPFMPQPAYDDLLAACDLNFVRGEDSLVRAIWAGKPFVWHIYPQSDAAHLVKLEAFLERYCAGLNAEAAHALRGFWLAWNAETATADDWHGFSIHLPEIAAHTLRWREKLAQLPDLATTLVDFCAEKGKTQL
ncbi:MAG: elongation factor P maturation arginine rhamnosyltransferase EarP [Zoogloeaceae bacterium]|nr:elongation factor P maturation arginine rhamnosyltransferase EarP [Zoogloeaceae bacterium]